MVGDPGTRHAVEGSPGAFHKAILVLAFRGGGNNLGGVCTQDLFDASPHGFGVKVSDDPAGRDFISDRNWKRAEEMSVVKLRRP